MNTKFKRTVIATLVAGMLLTSFTSCNEKEGVPGTYEDVILNAAEDVNSKLLFRDDVKFDKIPVLYVEKELRTDKPFVTVFGYVAPTEDEKLYPLYNKGTLYLIQYDITEEEYEIIYNLFGNSYRITHDEFTNEIESEFNKIVTKYNPSNIDVKKVEYEYLTMPLDEFLGHLEENTEEKGE